MEMNGRLDAWTLYLEERAPFPLLYKVGWDPELVWILAEEKNPYRCRNSNPDSSVQLVS
jgi:hypothetical protein